MMSSHVVNVVMISTSCERWFNAQEEMLALSGTQRHIGGPLCTNKLQKNGMFCGLPKPIYQTACFGYIFTGWCYLYMAKSYIASYEMQEELRIDTIKALSLNHSRRSAVEGQLSKERHSSEARRRRASLLVIGASLSEPHTDKFRFCCVDIYSASCNLPH